jgi:hypothetical protein
MTTWTPLAPTQTPAWGSVADSQNPGWGAVAPVNLVGNGFQVGPFQLNFQQAYVVPINWSQINGNPGSGWTIITESQSPNWNTVVGVQAPDWT